jgi:hypothetical protein
MRTGPAQPRAQVATDIYRALPEDERTAVTKAMAVGLGNMWFGSRVQHDEEAVTQPAHADDLAAALVQRGHMTPISPPVFEPPTSDDWRESGTLRWVILRTSPQGRQPGKPVTGRSASLVPLHPGMSITC